jgi:hypothetical protein
MSEDYLAQKPIARWNGARGVWEKPETVNLLCEHLELFSETWPSAGTMRNGMVWRLQTRVHRTEDSESLSLPTPAANESGFTFQAVDKNGVPTNNPNERWYHPETGRLVQKGIIQVINANNLLRTPAASEGERGHQPEEKAKARGGQVTLSGQFMNLPTPTVADTFTDSLKSSQQKPGSMHSVNLSQAVHMTWGRFESAVKRWEKIIGHSAPPPTEPTGKDGAQRLSSKFTEWMMGLEPGWITGVGLSRKDELKACGNGVVPQQARLALTMLKARFDVE